MRAPGVAVPQQRDGGQRNGDVWGGVPTRRSGRGPRRRSWALAAIGTLLTVGSTVFGLVVWNGSGTTRELLVAARAIPAGHVMEPADLRPVRVGAAEGVSAVAATGASDLVGRTASVPVAAGALIPADLVAGAGVLPPPGWVVLSVAVGPGVVPPEAGPGSAVRVLPTPAPGAPGTGASTGRSWEAVLIGVAAWSGETAVVSLQVLEVDAAGVTAAGADIAIVVLSEPR